MIDSIVCSYRPCEGEHDAGTPGLYPQKDRRVYGCTADVMSLPVTEGDSGSQTAKSHNISRPCQRTLAKEILLLLNNKFLNYNQ